MKNAFLALVVLASLGSSRPSCGPFRPKPDQNEDEAKKPLKVQEHCNQMSGECYSSCFRREASYSCAQCCYKNTLLCDHNDKYDFAPCELIDPAPAPLPDAGTGDAGDAGTGDGGTAKK